MGAFEANKVATRFKLLYPRVESTDERFDLMQTAQNFPNLSVEVFMFQLHDLDFFNRGLGSIAHATLRHIAITARTVRMSGEWSMARSVSKKSAAVAVPRLSNCRWRNSAVPDRVDIDRAARGRDDEQRGPRRWWSATLSALSSLAPVDDAAFEIVNWLRQKHDVDAVRVRSALRRSDWTRASARRDEGLTMSTDSPLCRGEGWLCEGHPDRPWRHDECDVSIVARSVAPRAFQIKRSSSAMARAKTASHIPSSTRPSSGSGRKPRSISRRAIWSKSGTQASAVQAPKRVFERLRQLEARLDHRNVGGAAGVRDEAELRWDFELRNDIIVETDAVMIPTVRTSSTTTESITTPSPQAEGCVP
jgi:hypothetical protein